MEKIKAAIENHLFCMDEENRRLEACLTDEVSLTDYSPSGDDWTDALCQALSQHEIVIIPKRDKPYIISHPVTIPSGRKISAHRDAQIRLKQGVKTLMLRNTLTKDGTHFPINPSERNENITIEGGIWEDWCESRLGYGNSGMYDSERSFFGVSTLMLLECINHLTLKHMTFKNCGGFAVQMGDVSNVTVEDITFINCFADGLHINGNVDSIHIMGVRGEVGDDLVAFNMYDWQNSSINFGPCKNVICEDLVLSDNSYYKALRIEPGIYTFDDGQKVDCSLENAIFRRISNIKTFKLYCQTPPYFPWEKPEAGGVGSGNNIIFEDIKIKLDAPIDLLKEYTESDPVKGTFAAFELGLNVDNLYLSNIDISLDREKYPLSYLLSIGPKAARFDNGQEVFDPYFSSKAKNIYLSDILINGKRVNDISPFIKEIVFDNIYNDTDSSGSGKIENIHYK